MSTLRLTDQADLNLVISHANSSPKEFLKNKTPIEMTRFLNEELMNRLLAFRIQEIEKDKVVLKPYLQKNNLIRFSKQVSMNASIRSEI